MTDRGRHLQGLLDEGSNGVDSVRGLARMIVARRFPDRPPSMKAIESVRRSLLRYLSDEKDRDPGDEVVAEISAIMGVTPESWPLPRKHPISLLKEAVVEREQLILATLGREGSVDEALQGIELLKERLAALEAAVRNLSTEESRAFLGLPRRQTRRDEGVDDAVSIGATIELGEDVARRLRESDPSLEGTG